MLDWDDRHAYALQDANLDDTQVLQQWAAINQASDIDALKGVLQRIQGIPWVNTLAVDDSGAAVYLNASRVPNVPGERLAKCALPPLVAKGLPGLDGSRSACDWQADSAASVPGLVAGQHLPSLSRRDFVQNSNDSAWMTNPAEPLTSFSPLVSQQGRPLGLRSRYALTQLQAHTSQALDEDFLQRLVTDNRVYLADLILDDLLALCDARSDDPSIAKACQAMAGWDRTASTETGIGFLYFQRFVAALPSLDGLWKHPFDRNAPVNTPRGLAWNSPEAAEKLVEALRHATTQVEQSGLPDSVKWGQVQHVGSIAIPGGNGHVGIYNAIESQPADDGSLRVVGGSSYVQLVSFGAQGPLARGLLSFSQSSDPASPHFQDQTALFSQQHWPALPFSDAQIAADPNLETLRLR